MAVLVRCSVISCSLGIVWTRVAGSDPVHDGHRVPIYQKAVGETKQHDQREKKGA